MKLLKLLFICLISFNLLSARLDTKSKQLVALEAVLAELETHYGMSKFKEKTFGVTVESTRKKYSALIKNAETLEEFYSLVPKVDRKILSPTDFEQLLIALSADFWDGHFNITRNTKERYVVGINAVLIDGKLQVMSFDEKYFIPGNSNSRSRSW